MTDLQRSNFIYFYAKMIDACICFPSESNVDELLEDNHFLDSSVAYQILEILLDEKCHYMDKQMKENAHRVLSYFEKHYTDINRAQLIEKTNDLIIAINRCDDSEIDYMIEGEFEKRFYDKRLVRKNLPDRVSRLEYVKMLIVRDFNVLLTHSSVFNDEEFNKMLDTYVLESIEYMSCINSIILEYPEIMSNSLFSSRVSVAANKINKNRYNKKIYKAYKKIIKL